MSDMVQMMLVAECVPESAEPLKEALERFDISCVLIAPPGWQPNATNGEDREHADDLPALDQAQCQTLVGLIQEHDTAAIVANDAALAVTVGADGCHLDVADALEDIYSNAREFLGADAIVGAMPGFTRHVAMSLAEAGADYVGYVVQDENNNTGLEFVSWWAEIFESPVVAFTDGNVPLCQRAIDAGPPDFLAMPLPKGQDIDHLADIAQLIADCGQLPIAVKDAK